jgi:hypothetical protein
LREPHIGEGLQHRQDCDPGWQAPTLLCSPLMPPCRARLFNSTGTKETERSELPDYTNRIFHGYLSECQSRHPILRRAPGFSPAEYNENLGLNDVTGREPRRTQSRLHDGWPKECR